MITLCVIAYVIISLYYAFKATLDDYTIHGDLIRGKETKPALIQGFMTIPAMVLAITIVGAMFWLLVKVAYGVGWVIVWIYNHMP